MLFRSQYEILQINQKKLKNITNEGDNGQGVLKIVVKDTGTGIKAEDLPKLFEKFSQFNDDPGQRKIGTGLGLYITKELTRKMNGDIRVYSKFGVGSSFVVCIPCQQVALAELVEPSINPMVPLNLESIRTMIVDDDASNVKVFAQYLLQKKMQVTETAGNGFDAFQKYQQHALSGNPINLILMDLNMPTMDGKESCQRIRAFEQEHMLKPSIIIIASGNCVDSEIKKCMDPAGNIRAQGFLKKPIPYKDLSLTIDELVSKFM